ncbi:MAG TPA: hypothetical protein VGP68_00155 [Gemmataceae bacterium]|jgi:hypothetical protein|nr:hypothetical protein [Gemmataceae bacterium]
MKALALKELRELRGIAAVALVAYLILAARMMGVKAFDWVPGMPQNMEYPPFLSGEFLSFFSLLAGLFAIALGFRQSAWESSQGTYLYLLHRPISRQAVFFTKLATGAGVFVACSAMPIVLYGWWAATPGRHPSPFRWSWSLPSWCMIAVLCLIYLGAFLSGLRPAKWFGTRLLPLAAAFVLAVLLWMLNWLVIGQIAALVFAVGVYVCAIRYVAQTRDYA